MEASDESRFAHPPTARLGRLLALDVLGHGQQRRVAPCFLTVTRNRDPRFDWLVCFVLLSIVAAAYFVSAYWNRD
jgi:hypothetical protein